MIYVRDTRSSKKFYCKEVPCIKSPNCRTLWIHQSTFQRRVQNDCSIDTWRHNSTTFGDLVVRNSRCWKIIQISLRTALGQWSLPATALIMHEVFLQRKLHYQWLHFYTSGDAFSLALCMEGKKRAQNHRGRNDILNINAINAHRTRAHLQRSVKITPLQASHMTFSMPDVNADNKML